MMVIRSELDTFEENDSHKLYTELFKMVYDSKQPICHLITKELSGIINKTIWTGLLIKKYKKMKISYMTNIWKH